MLRGISVLCAPQVMISTIVEDDEEYERRGLIDVICSIRVGQKANVK